MRVKRYNNTVRKSKTAYGALAQLVARNVRIVEVRGSNPLCSITKSFSKEKDFCIMCRVNY